MFYKPKYCCNCSEKIERSAWGLRASRRFCQLCETEFVPHEWIPRLIVVFGMIGAVFGFAVYFQKSDKPLKISASAVANNAPQSKTDLSSQPQIPANEAKSSVQTQPQTAANSAEQKQKQSAPTQRAFVQTAESKAVESNRDSAGQVYFCGAMTKKGTACSRRVKGGGRCWQHAGEPAILPPEKLIASR